MFSSDPALVSNQIPISLDFPDNLDEFNLFVQMIIKRIANATNSKESGLYIPLETASFISYFTPDNPQKLRNVYRKVIDFGPLPDTGLGFESHGIPFTSEYTMTRIYGTATDPTNLKYIPLPYVEVQNPLDGDIQLYANGTEVFIYTASDRSNFTRCYIVLEYVKNQ